MATGGKTAARKKKVTAEVTLRGRFRPGQRVRLYRASGAEQLRHSEGDELLAVKRVDDDASVTFTDADGVVVGQRYLAFGYVNGQPVTARVTGREPGDSAGGQAQEPVGLDEVKHGDGTVAGERGQPKAEVEG